MITAGFCCGSSFFIRLARLLCRFPSGAMLVGVTCLNLFMWITEMEIEVFSNCVVTIVFLSCFAYFEIYKIKI
jgi:hypothetical protein